MRGERRARLTALGAAAVVCVALLVSPARSADMVLGSGDVKTEFLSIGPETAGLAAGVVIGETIADFQNDVGRAQARSVNMGVLGTTLTAESCPGKDPTLQRRDLPMTVRVDSREPGAAEGRTGYWPILPRDLSHHFDAAKEENGGFPNVDPAPESPGRSNLSRLHAHAAPQPLAESTSDTGVVSVAGVADVVGGRTTTSARVEGDRRIAEGTVTIPEISLGGGAVVLRDLVWRARQTTGLEAPADATYEASFRLGGVTVGDATYGWPEGSDAAALEQATALANLVNTALAPTGLAVVLPATRQDGDHAIVTPLEVKVERSPLGHEAFTMLPPAAYEARRQLAEALITRGDCQFENLRFSSLIAVGDITLATPAGSGVTRVSFGGADAFTEGTVYGNPFATRPRGTPTPPAVLGKVEPPGPVQAPTPSAPTVRRAGAPSRGGDGLTAAGQLTVPGSKSGTAALVGGLGLVAVLGVALLDLMKPRRVVEGGG